MKKISILFLFLIQHYLFVAQDQGFIANQLSFPRVLEAHEQKFESIRGMFEKKGVNFPSSHIYWRGFKWEKRLELWAYHQDSQRYVLIENFPICDVVGDLGPKREQGDFQIPEGYYCFTNFNPLSSYHLSIKLNYPNESDAILGNKNSLGGDIYVHGRCETIGCLPMTDERIKEIYIINMYARANGQEYIPIHIFPAKMTIKNMNKLKYEYFKDNVEIINFWNNLKLGYDYFNKYKIVPEVSVDYLTGKYIIK